MRFRDKVVLVTGAASGIGASTAAQFRAEGTVVGLDLQDGPDLLPCDVRDRAQVKRAWPRRSRTTITAGSTPYQGRTGRPRQR